jgi:hypothetical protein
MTNGKPWPYDTPRPCAGCAQRLKAFGLTYCGLGKWAGTGNEKACDEKEVRHA